eukprot:COSAG01_NODE_32491_length_580_cov_1.085239_1_plen_108_part_01
MPTLSSKFEEVALQCRSLRLDLQLAEAQEDEDAEHARALAAEHARATARFDEERRQHERRSAESARQWEHCLKRAEAEREGRLRGARAEFGASLRRMDELEEGLRRTA